MTRFRESGISNGAISRGGTRESHRRAALLRLSPRFIVPAERRLNFDACIDQNITLDGKLIRRLDVLLPPAVICRRDEPFRAA